jgi:hypothetical protein
MAIWAVEKNGDIVEGSNELFVNHVSAGELDPVRQSNSQVIWQFQTSG